MLRFTDTQGRTYRLDQTHAHLCPTCKVAYNCAGTRCGAVNGEPHPACSEKSRAVPVTRQQA